MRNRRRLKQLIIQDAIIENTQRIYRNKLWAMFILGCIAGVVITTLLLTLDMGS